MVGGATGHSPCSLRGVRGNEKGREEEGGRGREEGREIGTAIAHKTATCRV